MDTFKQMFLSLEENKKYEHAKDLAKTAYETGLIDLNTLITAVCRCEWGENHYSDQEFIDHILWGGNL